MEPRVITGRQSSAAPDWPDRTGNRRRRAVRAVRWGASLLISYAWWKEMGQVTTWLDLYAFTTLPVAAATLIAWFVLLIAHGRAVKFAGGRVSDYPLYSRLAYVAMLALAFFVADASIDNWTVLRFAGSRSLNGPPASATRSSASR